MAVSLPIAVAPMLFLVADGAECLAIIQFVSQIRMVRESFDVVGDKVSASVVSATLTCEMVA
jgi:hypothetical protein